MKLIDLSFGNTFNLAITPDQPKSLKKVQVSLGVAGPVWTHPIKNTSLGCYLSFMNTSIQKIKDIDGFLPDKLIKKSYNDQKRAFWLGSTLVELSKATASGTGTECLSRCGWQDKNNLYSLEHLNINILKIRLLTLPIPCISRSCIKIKINLNFYYHTSL